MKTFLRITFYLVSFSAGPSLSLAESNTKIKTIKPHHAHKHESSKVAAAEIKTASKEKIVIQVKGMVCSFCAQGIEKNFNKKPQVKSTKVDLEKMEVSVTLKPKKTLSTAEIKKVVTEAGFAFEGIKK